jgi:multimeric flavodoxin WrbA
MPFLLNKLAESDGIILGAPAYNLMPPGLLIMIMNRSLGSGKDYREKVAKNPKVGGVITVGGTDWVNLVLPLTNLSLFRLLRGNIKIVDQMLVPYIPRPGQVLLHDDAITRAGRIGHNVVEALNMPYSEVEFQSGEEAETCPLCHNNLLKVKGKFVECPICDIKGTIETRGRKVMVIFEEKALRKSRYGTWGTKRHDDAVAKGHKEYYDRKPDIDEKLKKYKSHKRATTTPSLKESKQ